jgi:hypothetical protein
MGNVDEGKGKELEPKLSKERGWTLNQCYLTSKSSLNYCVISWDSEKGPYCHLNTSVGLVYSNERGGEKNCEQEMVEE